jgi:metallo-beta-lactamase family protein
MENPAKSAYPQFVHHGAAGGVTGSCHRYLASADTHLLIDCGLFQGQDVTQPDHHSQHRIGFDISAIQALIVTHVHIDHVGRIPYLFAAGFRGPIYCSEPSARLLPLVIEDALKVGFTKDEALIDRFLVAVHQMLRPVPYKQWQVVADTEELTVKLRLQRAGHILGSAYVEIDSFYKKANRHHRTVFSGDLGAPYAPLLPAPRAPYGCDALVIESTYGNRLHEGRRERRERLRAVITHALQNQGTVMIPAFSIGRTQEILYELEGLIFEAQRKKLAAARSSQQRTQDSAENDLTGSECPVGTVDWSRLQVIVDSPLASRFNEVYRELKPFWDAEAQQIVRAGRHPLSFENLITVDSHEAHQKVVAHLARTRQPAVVLAASGMAAGGRIVNYLKAMLNDAAHCVLFTGYQARGTTGHRLLQIGKNAAGSPVPTILIDGAETEVRAVIRSIGGYSAHADQKDLLNFVTRMRKRPAHVRIIHGERRAREELRGKLNVWARAQGVVMEIVLPDQG